MDSYHTFCDRARDPDPQLVDGHHKLLHHDVVRW